jgi:hypothetical protein
MEEVIVFFSFVVVIIIWAIIANIRRQLEEGRWAQSELEEARSKIQKLNDNIRSSEDSAIQKTRNLRQDINLLRKSFELQKQKVERYKEAIKSKDDLYKNLCERNNESLEHISSLVGDHLTLQYALSAEYLEGKKHPALKEAKRIKELRKETKDILKKSKILQYKFEFILQLFPDLELYIEDVESIAQLANLDKLEDIDSTTDRVRYYLSKEEYNQLSESERNQLALDRYIKSQKTKWQIGRDYELFIGQQYTQNGWDVEFFGIDKGLEDMGRDLVATKGKLIHVIQCKYWGQQKLIHEKHISQLYGTTVQYILSSKTNKKVVPVFATNISLSPTAQDFADYLDVMLIKKKLITDFPRIKCNINRDSFGKKTKIYHLPMDQQYDRTKVCDKGEFFAYTVKEAESAGFRRALKWFGKGN